MFYLLSGKEQSREVYVEWEDLDINKRGAGGEDDAAWKMQTKPTLNTGQLIPQFKNSEDEPTESAVRTELSLRRREGW